MAEFQEIMKQAKRMCGSMDDCNNCPFAADGFSCGYAHLIDDDKTPEQVAEFERIVMDWAEKNPELMEAEKIRPATKRACCECKPGGPCAEVVKE